jgi:hypothetical protein
LQFFGGPFALPAELPLIRFVVPPAKAERIYAPNVFGRTAASVVEIR